MPRDPINTRSWFAIAPGPSSLPLWFFLDDQEAEAILRQALQELILEAWEEEIYDQIRGRHRLAEENVI